MFHTVKNYFLRRCLCKYSRLYYVYTCMYVAHYRRLCAIGGSRCAVRRSLVGAIIAWSRKNRPIAFTGSWAHLCIHCVTKNTTLDISSYICRTIIDIQHSYTPVDLHNSNDSIWRDWSTLTANVMNKHQVSCFWGTLYYGVLVDLIVINWNEESRLNSKTFVLSIKKKMDHISK